MIWMGAQFPVGLLVAVRLTVSSLLVGTASYAERLTVSSFLVGTASYAVRLTVSSFLVGTASYAVRRIRRQLSNRMTDRSRPGPYKVTFMPSPLSRLRRQLPHRGR